MTLDKKIKELERRCPSVSFALDVRDGETVIAITEFDKDFVVREEWAGLEGVWPVNWFDFELSKRPADVPDQPSNEKYCVLCSRCGKVPLGYGNYCRQMMKPDQHWYCPRCGGTAEFDDETYESYMEEQL